jgi:T-complex protein 1 subunit epsilon
MNIDTSNAQVAFDDNGQPFIILRDQGKQERLKGPDAHRANILAACTVGKIMCSSLGPVGMDKMLVSPDADATVTNDGATILQKMQVTNQIGKLLVELSASQDDEIGDGTTGVVVLASAMLEQAEQLLMKGIHPMKVAVGYEHACLVALDHLEKISDKLHWTPDDTQILFQTAKTTLSSKIVNRFHDKMAKIAVDAVLAVADLERKDVNFDLIKMQGKIGGRLEDTVMVQGIVLDKPISHPQMDKVIENAKIALLTSPFEPPKTKNKAKLNISTTKQYQELYEMEQKYFRDQVAFCKNSGANFIICQWGFDDEANHLLLQNKLPSVRWCGGAELELIAIATGARITPRFEELDAKRLGTAKKVEEIEFGTSNDRMIVISGCPSSGAVTVFVRGGNHMIVDEAKRSLHDAMCVVRNLIKDNRIVYGGGAPEISCSIRVAQEAKTITGEDQYIFRAFADALEDIPIALGENAGVNAIANLAELKSAHINDNNPYLGVDCNQVGINDMKVQGVYEAYSGKRQQFLLATQLVKMILKINDVIEQGAV